MADLQPEKFQIPLSAEAFIEALQGKAVYDLNGERRSFFYKKYKINGYEYKNIVVIEHILVKEEIKINQNQVFEYSIIFIGGEFQREFRIEGGEFQSSFFISGGEFQREFRIEGGEFQSSFSIEGGEFQSYFFISGGEFQWGFRISGGEFQSSFSISGGEFKSYFRISGGEFQSSFRISGGEFKGFFFISGGEFKSDFRISGGEFQWGFRISGGEFQNIRIFNGGDKSYISHISLNVFIRWEINIEKDSQINTITFQKNIKSDGAVYLRDFNINQIAFTGFENEGTLSLMNIQAQSLIYDIEEETKDNEITKTLIKPKNQSLLKIENSDLGKAKFINVGLDQFDELIMNGTKVNEISTTDTHFPLRNILTEKNNGKIKSRQAPGKLAEIYNQLYLAMQKQGNRSQELEYYAQYLHWRLKAYLNEGLKNIDFSAVVSLWFNRISTRYSTSWIQGLIGILVVGWIFYFLYIASLPEYSLFKSVDWGTLSLHFRHFPEFLFPARKFNYITGTSPGFLANTIDILGRVFISFWVYQTIMAFRRYGRK